MKLATIKKLCCPYDKSDLTLRVMTKNEYEEILEGVLVCEKCKRIYPIISGIPIMNPDEYRSFELEQPILEKWEKTLEIDFQKNFKLSL